MITKDPGDGGPPGDTPGTAGGDTTAEAAKVRGLQDEIRDGANRAMPGRRAAFPPGTLVKEPFDRPQSDEHRDQPVKPDGDLTTPSKPPGV